MREKILAPAGRNVFNGTSQWWLDGELGVPIRGTIDGLGRVTLEELKVAEDSESLNGSSGKLGV